MRRCRFAGEKPFKNDEKGVSYVCPYAMGKRNTKVCFTISGSQIVSLARAF